MGSKLLQTPKSDLRQAARRATIDLLAARDERGIWTGELSSSALSTATAISALGTVFPHESNEFARLVEPAVRWLVEAQNPDGGWGDTSVSHSNISTTMLSSAALTLAGCADLHASVIEQASRYVDSKGGIDGLRKRYGRDRTFAVPILANAAIAGQVDWREVAALPFELACFPQSWYRFLRLPVVSYAIPALVAVGQVIHYRRPSRNPLIRKIRDVSIEPSLRTLERIQPASGGFLEAIPLTSFVVMSLASCGRADHAVTQQGIRFLKDTIRDDGSWPIDTNLATWNTTLALNALTADRTASNSSSTSSRLTSHAVASPADVRSVTAAHSEHDVHDASTGSGESSSNSEAPRLSPEEHARCIEWLLSCQNVSPHLFTGADPGGWGWSDLSGAVPDADDTPGALLALRHYCDADYAESELSHRAVTASAAGVKWLLDLQNRDGGWPTFCRGWGKLPFDRSGNDLTAHALRALNAWRTSTTESTVDPPIRPLVDIHPRIDVAAERGWRYLARNQNQDGSWTPLWFGNQHHVREENPVYGTAKCLFAYRDCGQLSDPAAAGIEWMWQHQNQDGGWGGDGVNSSVEETALAFEALVGTYADDHLRQLFGTDGNEVTEHEATSAPLDRTAAIRRAEKWLVSAVKNGEHRCASPIGLYFAKLWYHESTYPLAFAASALKAADSCG